MCQISSKLSKLSSQDGHFGYFLDSHSKLHFPGHLESLNIAENHDHHSFLSDVGKVALDIGKGVVTEGIVGLL